MSCYNILVSFSFFLPNSQNFRVPIFSNSQLEQIRTRMVVKPLPTPLILFVVAISILLPL